MSFMVLDNDDINFIWESINHLRIVFHPVYAPEGKFNYSELCTLKQKKDVMIFLDRNLLSSLLKLCQNGSLKNEKEMRIIAIIMTWSIMNDLSISAGLALKENAIKAGSSNYAKIELNRFTEIFEQYHSMTWLYLAEGRIDKIPRIVSSDSYKTSIAYHKEDDHLLMHLAEMLHIVYLYRKKDLSPVEKIINYLSWHCENLLISQYTNTYITLLFTHHKGFHPPKNANSNDINRIMDGCYNQAWDLTYLTIWSTLYSQESVLKDVFLFSTADKMLRYIFINTHATEHLFNLLMSVFPSKSANKIMCLCEKILGPDRKKPDFGEHPQRYFRALIRKEKQRIVDSVL